MDLERIYAAHCFFSFEISSFSSPTPAIFLFEKLKFDINLCELEYAPHYPQIICKKTSLVFHLRFRSQKLIFKISQYISIFFN